MGKNVDDTAAVFKACTECSRACQTMHARGMRYSVPKFQKLISEHSTPSNANCTLQVPATFIRNHIGVGKKHNYVLEGASGHVCVVTFINVGFEKGWKEFATLNQLEKGDGVTLSLISPNRFHVSVFDKHGDEKTSLEPYRPRGMIYTSPSPSGMIVSRFPPSAVVTKEHPVVSNFPSGGVGAEDYQRTTPLREPPAEVPKDDGLGSARTAGRNGSHEKGTVLGHHEPTVGHEAEPSGMSQSSDDSDDSIQVRLAKAVLAKAKEKKLKNRRKTSCTSAPVETATAKGATPVAAEACKSLQKDVTADGTPSHDSPRHDGPVDGPASVVEKPCEKEEEPRALVFGANNIHPTGVITRAAADDEVVAPVVGLGRNELPTDRPKETFPEEEEFLLPQKWPIEEKIGEADTATGVSTGEGGRLPLSGVEMMSPVKLEPGLFADLGLASRVPYYQTVVGACCTVCGLRRELPNPVRPTRQPKAEHVMTAGFPEGAPSPGVRSPSAENANDAWRPGRATEYQKQRAIAAANELSDKITNPNALVLMRIGWTSNSYDCFLSVMCSEMLPSKPTHLVVIDTEGRTQIVQWEPDQRYLTGPGWKEFVDSHNLYICDVCVLEVIDSSLQNFTVKLHLLLAHEMERSPKPQTPPPEFVSEQKTTTPPAGAAAMTTTPVAPVPGTGAKTRSRNVLHGLVSPSKTTNKRTRTPTSNVDDGIHEIPTNNTNDDEFRVAKYSPMKRLRRASSASPSTTRGSTPSSGTREVVQPRATPATKGKQKKAAPKRQPIKHKATPPAKKPTKAEVTKPAKKPAKAEVATPAKAATATKAKGGAASRSASTGKATTMESPKAQTENSERVFYRVAKTIDRRKNFDSVVFLVELADPVMIPRTSERMKAQLDAKGRWWVPYHHFNPNFTACYIAPYTEAYEHTKGPRYAANVVIQTGDRRKTLVMREFTEESVPKLLEKKDALASCDVIAFVYDSADAESWRRAFELLTEVASHQEITGHEVPCLLVASKDDLGSDPSCTKGCTRVCTDMGLEATISVSIKLGDTGNVFRKIVDAAQHPHLSLPETEAGRKHKHYRQLIHRSLTVAAVGVTATVAGIAIYRLYNKRKNC